MTARAWRPVLFGLVCLAQIALPASMIWRAEQALASGRPFRFRTLPVDPADLVRGRYVALRFEATHGPALDAEPFEPGQTVHARLEEDAEGFARVIGVGHQQPEGNAHLTVRVERVGADAVHFRFPVDRFYLPEEKAPEAERAYRQAAGRRAWAEIRIYAGRAVIEDLLIEGTPIGEYVEALPDAP